MFALKRLTAAASLALALGSVSISVSATGGKHQDAAMTQMMMLGAPSEHHRVLNVFVGKWNYTATWQMSPGDKAQAMKGSEEIKWILGGRFIEEDVTGGAPQHPFQGMGLIGYDNIKQEYVSVWVDNESTGLMVSSSQYDYAAKTFKESGSVSSPATPGKNQKYRAETKVLDQNHFTYSVYMQDSRGNEFKSMQIDYTRAQ